MACKGAVPLIPEWESLLGCELLKVKNAGVSPSLAMKNSFPS